MDHTAIKAIQDTAITATGIIKTHTPAVALPKEWEIKSLDHLQHQPTRFKGTYSTNNIDSFIDYVTSLEKSICFIDPDNISAKAFFNLGDEETPGHGDHKATLKLNKTIPFEALLKINLQKLTQRELIEWLLDWRTYIMPIDDQGEPIVNLKQVITNLQKIEIKATGKAEHVESNLSTSKSAFEKIEAAAGELTPAGFRFTCTPYEGITERVFFLQLSILTSMEKPMLKLRIEMLDEHNNLIAIEFKDKLTNALEATQVYIGDFSK